jgi:hypothetical protein
MSSSSCRIPADSVGCDTRHAAAARAKCRSLLNAKRYSKFLIIKIDSYP